MFSLTGLPTKASPRQLPSLTQLRTAAGGNLPILTTISRAEQPLLDQAGNATIPSYASDEIAVTGLTAGAIELGQIGSSSYISAADPRNLQLGECR